jgi:hypothetical protein
LLVATRRYSRLSVEARDLSRRGPYSEHVEQRAASLAGVAAILLIAVGSGCSSSSGETQLSGIDWKAWRAPDAATRIQKGLTARERITDQLLGCHCLEGTDRGTLIDLTGQPDDGHKVGGRNTGPKVPTAGVAPKLKRAIRGSEREVNRIQAEVEEGSSEVLQYTLGPCIHEGRCFFPGSETEYLDVYIDLEGRVKKIDQYGT